MSIFNGTTFQIIDDVLAGKKEVETPDMTMIKI